MFGWHNLTYYWEVCCLPINIGFDLKTDFSVVDMSRLDHSTIHSRNWSLLIFSIWGQASGSSWFIIYHHIINFSKGSIDNKNLSYVISEVRIWERLPDPHLPWNTVKMIALSIVIMFQLKFEYLLLGCLIYDRSSQGFTTEAFIQAFLSP